MTTLETVFAIIVVAAIHLALIAMIATFLGKEKKEGE